MRVPDTSVIVPALAEWHPSHQLARASITPGSAVVWHCLIEAYSVLTRMSDPHGADPPDVAEALSRLFESALVLDGGQAIGIAGALSSRGVSGGATYDGVIALTAAQHRATLVTRDARAAATYRACGVTFELLRS